jgi:integrase/recombinase XerD
MENVSLTKVEVTKLLNAAKENPLHHLAILVAYTHGLRASEVCEMTAGQVKDGYLFVRRKKGSEPTYQPLMGDERELLIERVSGLSQGERVFPFTPRWFQKFMNKYGAIAGIPYFKATPHKLKHTCAMISLEGGLNIHELQTFLGHKSLASTGKYLKISQDQASRAYAKVMGF